MKTRVLLFALCVLFPAIGWAAPIDPSEWEKPNQYWEVIIDHGFVYGVNKISPPEGYENEGYVTGYCLYDYIGEESDVVVPDSVVMLRSTTFWERHHIKTITLPKECWYVEMMNAFNFCDNLEAIYVEDGNPTFSSDNGVLVLKKGQEIAFYPPAKKVEEYIVPDYITDIYINIGNQYLKKIIFTGNMPKLYYNDSWETFLWGCTNLEAIEGQSDDPNYSCIDGVLYNKDVSKLMFCPQGRTKPLSIPKSVNAIETSTLFKCNKLTKITAEEGGSVTVKDNILYTDNNANLAFCIRTKIGRISGLPSTLQTIGYRAFENCNAMEVEFPAGVRSVADAAFRNCANLRAVNLPDVTTIGYEAFAGCTSLTIASIPQAATIAERAFEGCTGLSAVTLPAAGESIGRAAFKDCPLLASVTIPQGVSKIEKSTFEGCSNLSQVVIPASVDSIKAYAFKNTGIVWLTIPGSVVDIQDQAFGYCHNMRTLTVEWTVNLPTTSRDAFISTTSTKPKLRVPQGSKSEYETTFPWRAFLIEEYTLPSRLPGGMLGSGDITVISAPGTDAITVRLREGIALKSVQLFDLSGRMIYSGTSPDIRKAEIGGSGYCLLHIETSGGYYREKVLL